METFSMFFQEGQQMQKGKAPWTNLLHHFHENECLILLTFSSAMTHSLTLHCQKRGLPHASLLQLQKKGVVQSIFSLTIGEDTLRAENTLKKSWRAVSSPTFILQHGDDHTRFHLSKVVSDHTCKIING